MTVDKQASEQTQFKKTVAVVLGMHRSGTSAITGVLAKLGVALGDQLLPAMAGVNDKGFFEHAELIAEHDALLGSMGYSWMDLRSMPEKWWLREETVLYRDRIIGIIERDFSDTVFYGIKDPRLCRLLPLWLDIFTRLACQPKVILCFRHPLAVVRSLMLRDQFDFHTSLILWFWHVLEAEQYSRGLKRSVVVYDEFLTDWQGVCHRLTNELDIVWPNRVTDCADSIHAFLDKNLNHGQVDDIPDSSRLAQVALRLYDSVQQNTIDTEVFDAVRQNFLAEIALLEPYLETLNSHQACCVKAADLERVLLLERKNAQEQIGYRDALVSELRDQLSGEKENAQEQIEYRDALVSELRDQLSAERKNAQEQIEYRDALVSELRDQLSAEKENAKKQIAYRDALIKLLEDERNKILGSRKELLKQFIRL